jgi:alkanesulfonate monooxygenase SsuD/methylene tetrahydromethanopterin reductase-like flavin-dependent oxidoreductase (luciferase family)
MRFGLALPQYGFSLPGGRIGITDVLDWSKRAETMGFDSVWLSDHFFYSFARYGADPSPISAIEPMTALAAVASVTSRVRLGTLVLCASFRTPPILAKAAATIDALSDGRFDLGLGAGWFEDEFEAFGFAFGSAKDRFDVLEMVLSELSAIRDGDATERVEAGGVLPPLRSRLWIGGRGGSRMMRLAAGYGDGWNCVWRVHPDAYQTMVHGANQACERIGRDPSALRRSVGLYSLVGTNATAAEALWSRARSSMPGGALDEESWEGFRADTLSGSPAEVIDKIGRYGSMGVDELIVSPWVLPFSVIEPEILDLYSESILPAFR